MSDRLPQGVKWNDADLWDAYVAGASEALEIATRSHNGDVPVMDVLNRAADAYVKLAHITRPRP